MKNQSEDQLNEKKHQFALASMLRIGFLLLLIILSFFIIRPFVIPVFWGIIIAVGIFPLFKKFAKLMANREKLAAILLTLFALTIIVIPSIMFTSNTVNSLQNVIHELENGTLSIPPPTKDVEGWPIIGKSIYDMWSLAATNIDAAILAMEPQFREYAPKLVSAVASLGMTVLQFIISIIISGVLLVNAKSGGKAAGKIFHILVGNNGDAFTSIAEGTIRSVVQGVLGIAVIQTILGGIGMAVVGVPGTGIWMLLVLMLAIMQLPPSLILIPVSIYAFTILDTTPAIIYLIYNIVVSVADTFLKPILLGRGVDVPMLVILLGAIGGMILSGIIGLFVGAVVLAITYEVFKALVNKTDLNAD